MGTGRDERGLEEKLARVNELLSKPAYSDDDKAEIRSLLVALGLEERDDGDWATLRQLRGKLVSRPRAAPFEIVADGRGAWIGSVERSP